MTIGFQNYDSSFFQIQIEGLNDPKMKKDISDRIISFEVVEEMFKVITGNIVIQDDDDLRYTNVLKGKRITCKWGYSNTDLSGQQAFRKQNNAREIFSPTLINRYISGRVKNPSGGGDENGVFTFNCSFVGNEYPDKTKPRKKFTSGTKTELVATIFKDMGIENFDINFRRGQEKLTKETAVTQGESNFRFLSRYAQEWHALFRIAYSNSKKVTKNGIEDYEPVGLFCNYDDDVSVKAFLKKIYGKDVSGDTSTFEYKLTGSPNVKSYTWQFDQGGSGSGDNVRVVVVNGQTQFYYMKADTEKVVYYKLNTKKMNAELSQKGDIASQAQWLTSMFDEANKGMDNLVTKGYFEPCNETTAPQGMGLSATMEVIGNPLYTCPARVKFGSGFPDFFHTKKGLTFYQTRVSHKINRSGYTCTIQVADAYTVSGGSLVG